MFSSVYPSFLGDEHFVRASGELSASSHRVRLFQSDSRDASCLSAQGALAGRVPGPLGRKNPEQYGSLRFWRTPKTPDEPDNH